jgi:hypothetical protein
MKAEIVEAWVEALRSGEYEQGKSFLNASGRFCPLGILCDLRAKSGTGYWIEGDVASGDDIAFAFEPDEQLRAGTYEEQATEFPPDSVLLWAEIASSFAQDLAHLNDVTGWDFEAIADVIEKKHREEVQS